MSAALRLIEAINRGDFQLPEHDGVHGMLTLLFRPMFLPEGQRRGRPRSNPPRQARPTGEVPTAPERVDLPDHLAIRERAAHAAHLGLGEARPRPESPVR